MKEILDYLNEKAGTRFRPTPRNLAFIEKRMAEGYEYEDFIKVIDSKVKEWLGTSMQKYIRPATLFNGEKFDQYIGQVDMGEVKEEIKLPYDDNQLNHFAAQHGVAQARPGESAQEFRARIRNTLELRH